MNATNDKIKGIKEEEIHHHIPFWHCATSAACCLFERAQAHNSFYFTVLLFLSIFFSLVQVYNLIIQLAGYFMYNKRHFPISFHTNLSHYRISSISFTLWHVPVDFRSFIFSDDDFSKQTLDYQHQPKNERRKKNEWNGK